MYKINIIEPIYLAINKCIAILNERVFDNKLKNLVFLIQSEKATKKNTYGTFCENIWKIDNNDYCEISLSAENLQLENPNELLITLVHEMLHYDNYLKGIKDTTRDGRFHNNHFKISGNNIGLIFKDKDPKKGWSEANPDDFLLEIFKNCINSSDLDKLLKDAKRVKPIIKKISKNYSKYECINCQIMARAKKDVKLICGSCMKPMLCINKLSNNKQDSTFSEEHK